VRAGADPKDIEPEAPRLPGDSLGSVLVIVNPWVTPASTHIVGDVPRPEGWEAMTTNEQRQYVVAVCAAVVARDLVR
jgi:hypothetical protein